MTIAQWTAFLPVRGPQIQSEQLAQLRRASERQPAAVLVKPLYERHTQAGITGERIYRPPIGFHGVPQCFFEIHVHTLKISRLWYTVNLNHLALSA